MKLSTSVIALTIAAQQTITAVHAVPILDFFFPDSNQPSTTSTESINLAPFADESHIVNKSSILNGHYLIKLKDQANIATHHDFLESFAQEHPETEVKHVYSIGSFQGYAIKVETDETLNQLRRNQDIEYVEREAIASIAATQPNAPWNLARVSQRELPLQSEYKYFDLAGEGVDIYIVDSGIRITHSEFEGRAIFGASFTSEPKPGDENGHGTHVAGTVAGKTYGAAKKATVIDVRVLDQHGNAGWSKVLAGLQWALESIQVRARPSIINISISGVRSRALNLVIKNLVEQGIHVVVAAGNNAVDACYESPASAAEATTVGSSSQSDKYSDFSNFGSCVDIIAPGEAVLSAWTGHDQALAYSSGTSMAAPLVSGIKALWLAQKNMSPQQLDVIMFKYATVDAIGSLPKDTINLLIYNTLSLDEKEGKENKKLINDLNEQFKSKLDSKIQRSNRAIIRTQVAKTDEDLTAYYAKRAAAILRQVQ